MIPTKESVFSTYIQNNPNIANSNIIDQLIANEREANKIIKSYLDEHDIAYINSLMLLQNSVSKKNIHPNKNGYKIIAETMEQYLLNSKFAFYETEHLN